MADLESLADDIGRLFPRAKKRRQRRRQHRSRMQELRYQRKEGRLERRVERGEGRGQVQQARAERRLRRVERPEERREARQERAQERKDARQEKRLARIDSRGREPAEDEGAWDEAPADDGGGSADAPPPDDGGEVVDAVPEDDGGEVVDAVPEDDGGEGSEEEPTWSGVRVRRGPRGPRGRPHMVRHGNLAMAARPGYRVAVAPVAEGLYIVGELPEQLADEVGIVPLILPWMVKATKKVLDKQTVTPDGKARPVRLLQPAKPDEAPTVSGPGRGPRRDAWGRRIRELPCPRWLDKDTAEGFGCECQTYRRR